MAESLDDEWEKDFDVEVTEEDLIAAQKFLKIDATKKSEGANDGVSLLKLLLCFLVFVHFFTWLISNKTLPMIASRLSSIACMIIFQDFDRF